MSKGFNFNTMAKDPAFLFYSSDFLTGTMFMSDEQVGKYIRLLCAQHQKGRLTEKEMINICKTYDEDIFSKFEKDEQGMYYNLRCEVEIEKRKKYSLSRSTNRKSKSKDKKHMINICKTYEQHMEIENINENKIENIKEDFKKSQILIDSLAKRYNVTPEKIKLNMKNFWLEKQGTFDKHITLQEVRKYFSNWLRLEFQKNPPYRINQ
jgi:uncharacterized protein YdaU (DUF1376 family)